MPENTDASTEPEAGTVTEPAAAAPETETPPWGDDFDPEKAWSLIQNLRSDKEKLQKRPTLSDADRQKLTEYDLFVEASKSDLEKAQEAAQQNATRAQALLDRAVKAEVKGLAANTFADPEDAHVFLDLSKYADGDGDIDTAAIQADLTDLLGRKPHLGKSPESRVPAPNPAQGSSASGPTRDKSLAEQIADAEKAGDVKLAIRLKSQQLIANRAAMQG